MNGVIENQYELQETAREAGVSIVTCGNCGDVLLHSANLEELQCPYCLFEDEVCSFPDFILKDHWIKGDKHG